jgi:hypothetical protein
MSDKQDPRISAPSVSNGSEGCEDNASQHRHSLPCAEDAAALLDADDNPLRSISRLHDDELSCVLAFLSLTDLAQLVRCNRRFIAHARKERSRELCLEGSLNIVPVASSALSHHVASLQSEHKFNGNAMITCDTLRQLHGLPRLTALTLILRDAAAISHFMQGVSPDNAAAALRTVLPTQLHSFSVITGHRYYPLRKQSAILASPFWAALGGMTQLTELHVEQHSEFIHVRPDLAGLSHLRKLTLGPAGDRSEYVDELKQLTQLRELTLHDTLPERIRLLCQPPHALQLENFALPSMAMDEETMRAVLQLPTLTALDVHRIRPEAWLLLPQLPLLHRLRFSPSGLLKPDRMASMCAALSRCSALVDLSFAADIVSADGELLTAEQEQAAWAALLNSVPNLSRFCVVLSADIAPLLAVLPLHLPVLEELSLGGWDHPEEAVHFEALAHPNLRLLELGSSDPPPPSQEEAQAWMGSERLPKLERYIRHPST